MEKRVAGESLCVSSTELNERVSPFWSPEKNRAEIAHRVIDNKTVVINLKEKTFHVLNETATKIWELIDGERTVAEIADEIQGEFGIGRDETLADCQELVGEMIEKDLLIGPRLFPAARETDTKEDDGLFENVRDIAIQKKIPIIVHIDVTYRCNLDCIHCYLVEEDRQELEASELKNILEQLAEAGTIYLTLSGGEILAKNNFLEVAAYARKLNFALRLLTNGTLWNEKAAEEIASLNPELVAISIYSARPEIHDGITRIPGSLQRSISAARTLRNKGVRVKLSTVVMKQNFSDYRSVWELSRELGASFQGDYRLTPKMNGDKQPLELLVDDNQMRTLLADPIFSIGREESELQQGNSGVFDKVPCGAGHMSCYLSPYGDMHPCVQLPLNCGNVKESGFEQIWRHSPEMERFRSITFSELHKCSCCNLLEYCRVCVGLNYVEGGDLLSPSPRTCREAELMKTLGRRRR